METRSSDGFLPVTEGSLYWRLDAAQAPEDYARPTILLLHAAVATSELWDVQVEFLVSKGWNCLRFDLLGYGRSYPSDLYLQSQPRQPYDAIEHIDSLRQSVLPLGATVIVVGLSIGASLALGYAIHHSEHVSGIALAAGGLRGFEYPNEPQEDALFEKADSLIRDGDVQGAANLMVRIWGDGPLQEPGRVAEDVADIMLKWNIDISARECAKIGGMALEPLRREPAAGTMLHTIQVPTAVAIGAYDETYTNASMTHLAEKVEGATIKGFPTAHMINLEQPDEFNLWLDEWLDEHFDTEELYLKPDPG